MICAADLKLKQCTEKVSGGGEEKRTDEESAAGTCSNSQQGDERATRSGLRRHSTVGLMLNPPLNHYVKASLSDEGDG